MSVVCKSNKNAHTVSSVGHLHVRMLRASRYVRHWRALWQPRSSKAALSGKSMHSAMRPKDSKKSAAGEGGEETGVSGDRHRSVLGIGWRGYL